MNIAVVTALLMFSVMLALPAIFIAAVPTPNVSLASLLVIVIIVYSSIRLAQIAASSNKRIVTTTFWLYVYVFLGVSALVQISTNIFPWGGSYNTPILVNTACMIVVGLIAFDIGQYFIPPIRTIGVLRVLRRPINKVAVTILSGLTLLAIPYLIQKVGGLHVVFLPRAAQYEAISEELGAGSRMKVLKELLFIPVYVCLIGAIVIWLSERRKGMPIGVLWKGMVVALLLITIIVNNPVSTARFQVGTIMLSLLFLLPWRRWLNMATIGGMIIALIVIFPFADIFRSSLDASLTDRIRTYSPVEEFLQGDYDSFQVVANSQLAAEKSGFQVGQQIGGAVLFWVPRSVWSDKPIHTGQWIADRMDYEFTNLSAPLWAEFYVDGGWILLIIGFVSYGYVTRIIDRWDCASRFTGRPQVISIVVPIYAGYQFFLLRGALMPSLAHLAVMIALALLCSVRFGMPYQRYHA